ncbi:acyl-CoA/acyl-ACP dehydrogenase [Actinoplanes bogorensis]|uniref:Acyl-CoA/acyl-ACP dehydrogenase n=1 Tax=Paractinoplanes bogorensis TaxID=1610840 RepID=A0ABS5YMF9_9ACTN|nr:acyl-CoA dehydrogenase family protein [Actinoplanes bogorensis]MBU2663933.1 acyl-CoA/acyl-ACP dehydrogenase [Actinoplanes bogorensis]
MSLPDVEEAAVKVLGAAVDMRDAARITLDQGWHLLGVPESEGGMGGTLADVAGVVRAISAAGLSSPLPELHAPVVLAVANRVVVPWGDGEENIAGEPYAVLASGSPSTGATLTRWRILHAARLVGGCQGAASRTAAYAATRAQFGRPIARFQAVSALVAEAHAQSVLAAAGLEAALADPGNDFVAIAALATASRAGGVVARVAHQVHGAIGITRELGLERLTRRLWAWRDLPGEAELEPLLGLLGEQRAWTLGAGDE